VHAKFKTCLQQVGSVASRLNDLSVPILETLSPRISHVGRLI